MSEASDRARPGVRCGRCGHEADIVLVIEPDPEIHRRLGRIERALGIIEHEEEQVMTTVEELRADFDTYKGDVGAAFARLQKSLDDALSNQGGIPADVQAAIDDVDSAIRGADAEANAVDQPAPGDGDPGEEPAPAE